MISMSLEDYEEAINLRGWGGSKSLKESSKNALEESLGDELMGPKEKVVLEDDDLL